MLNWVEVNLGAIKNNIRQIKRVIGPRVSLMAVVKANAYGHGLVPVSRTALEAGAEWLGVFNLEEGLKLRKSEIRTPVLILGLVEKKDLKIAVKNNLSLCLYDLETAKESAKFGAKVHLKIDTGMHRLGVLSQEAVEFAKKIKKLGLEIEGVFSHFAESTDKKYSVWQLKRFNRVLAELKKARINPKVIHMANSAGALTYPEARFNLARCGIALYGLSPHLKNRRPALSFKAKIIQVKDVQKGDYIGYKMTYKMSKAGRIAVLGVGYADGYDRGLSNRGEVLVKSVRHPVIGLVCMNQTIIAVSSQQSAVKIGDTATLIGQDGGDRITVEEIAEKLGTIPHEVVTRIPENVKRVYQ